MWRRPESATDQKPPAMRQPTLCLHPTPPGQPSVFACWLSLPWSLTQIARDYEQRQKLGSMALFQEQARLAPSLQDRESAM